MKKTIIASMIFVSSVAGVCLAGNNTTGNPPNPPVAGQDGPNGPNGPDNYANSATTNNSY